MGACYIPGMFKSEVRQANRVIEMARAMKGEKQNHRAFHVAAIFSGKRLISIGWNVISTHTQAKRFGYKYFEDGTHAETSAVIKSGIENLRDYKMFVCRIDNNNQVAYSKPCDFCCKMLQQVKIGTVFYTNETRLWSKLN